LGVQLERVPLVEQARSGGSQRLGDAAHAKPGELCDRNLLLEVGPAETLGPDDPAVHAYGDRSAGDVVARQPRADEATGLVDDRRLGSVIGGAGARTTS
jgi:hypothetical protein